MKCKQHRKQTSEGKPIQDITRVSQGKRSQNAMVCVRHLNAVQPKVIGIFLMAMGCNLNSVAAPFILLKQKHEFENLKRKEVTS